MRSSVESRASRRGSRTINLVTQLSARNASAPDQCSAAVNRRFANAAARQGGTAARGANARFSARKSKSLVDGASVADADVFLGVVAAALVPRVCEAALLRGGRVEVGVDAASSSGARQRDWTRVYNSFMKSLRSTLSASPGIPYESERRKRKKRGERGEEGGIGGGVCVCDK